MTNEDKQYWLRRAFKQLANGEKLKDVLRFLRDQLPQTRQLGYTNFQQINSAIDDIVSRCPQDERLAVEEFIDVVLAIP